MVDLRLGDCLEVMKTIPDNSIDAIITDPPFGIGFKYKAKELNDNSSDYWEWLKPIYIEMNRVLKDGGFIAIWQAQLYFKNFWNWYGDDIHIYAGCKNFVQLRKTPINYGYDPIVIKYKNGVPLRPNKPRRNIDFFVANTAKFVRNTNAIERRHPCPRPVDQVFEIVSNFTLENGIVLDPFMGSGTTGVACKELNRNFIGIELDETYFNIAKERIGG